MSLIDAIAARLTAEAPVLLTVDGAATLAEIADRPIISERTPAALIMPLAETAGPQQASIGSSQVVTLTVGVLTIVASAREYRHGEALDLLDAPRAAIRAALHGWSPTADHDDIIFAGGQLIKAQGGELHWLDRWSTRTHWRS